MFNFSDSLIIRSFLCIFMRSVAIWSFGLREPLHQRKLSRAYFPRSHRQCLSILNSDNLMIDCGGLHLIMAGDVVLLPTSERRCAVKSRISLCLMEPVGQEKAVGIFKRHYSGLRESCKMLTGKG